VNWYVIGLVMVFLRHGALNIVVNINNNINVTEQSALATQSLFQFLCVFVTICCRLHGRNCSAAIDTCCIRWPALSRDVLLSVRCFAVVQRREINGNEIDVVEGEVHRTTRVPKKVSFSKLLNYHLYER